MGPFSTATAAVRYSTFTGRAQRCGGFQYWRNTTNCYSCSWFCTILLEFSSMFLCKISFSSSSNARLPFSILKENKMLYLAPANGRCSVKKIFFLPRLHDVDTGWPVLQEKVILTRDCFFPPDYFTRDENGRNSFAKEFSCTSNINEFRSGTLCRILNYLTEHLKVSATKGSYLLRIERKNVIFTGSKVKTSKEYYVTPVKYVNLYQNT